MRWYLLQSIQFLLLLGSTRLFSTEPFCTWQLWWQISLWALLAIAIMGLFFLLARWCKLD
jgi:hypothetical protein